jgi:hypothetical protein
MGVGTGHRGSGDDFLEEFNVILRVGEKVLVDKVDGECFCLGDEQDDSCDGCADQDGGLCRRYCLLDSHCVIMLVLIAG